MKSLRAGEKLGSSASLNRSSSCLYSDETATFCTNLEGEEAARCRRLLPLNGERERERCKKRLGIFG
ncbi:unnamed protein product [Camellia sinensis]